MVDPKETNERIVEAGLDKAARKVWVKPRLESAGIRTDTRTGIGDRADASGHGAGTCLS